MEFFKSESDFAEDMVSLQTMVVNYFSDFGD